MIDGQLRWVDASATPAAEEWHLAYDPVVTVCQVALRPGRPIRLLQSGPPADSCPVCRRVVGRQVGLLPPEDKHGR